MSNDLILVKNPELKSYIRNTEDASIVLPLVNPVVIKKEFRPTSITQNNVSFVIQQTGRSIDLTQIKFKPKFRITATGKTTEGLSTNLVTNLPTSPYLFGIENFSIDNFGVNKWIKDIEIGQMQDLNRNPTLMEIQSLGFDIEKCEKQYGQMIGAFNGIGMATTPLQAFESSGLINKYVSANIGIYKYINGLEMITPTETFLKNSNFFKKNKNTEFFRRSNTNFITTETGTTLTSGKSADTYLINDCPFDGVSIYYTEDTETLTQTFDYEVDEYLVSRKIRSSMYSKNWQPDILELPRADSVVPITLKFNPDYFERMFLSSARNYNNTVDWSVQLIDFVIEITSYNTINMNYTPKISSLLYFNENNENPQQIKIIGNTNTSVEFNRSGRTSLPPYLIVFGDLSISLNDFSNGVPYGASSSCFADITALSMSIGAKGIDVLQGKTIQQLRRETALLLRNPEVYDMISHNLQRYAYDGTVIGISGQTSIENVGGLAGDPITVAEINEILTSLRLSFKTDINQQTIKPQKYPFIILDLTKLNMDFYDGQVPLSPMVNYGTPISYKVNVTYGIKHDYNENSNTLYCNAQCVEMYKRKMTIDMARNKIDDVLIEFPVSMFMKEVDRIKAEKPESITEMMVAGTWFENLMGMRPKGKKSVSIEENSNETYNTNSGSSGRKKSSSKYI